MTNLHDPLLTVEEAAELLGTGPGLPLRLVAEGLLDHTRCGDEIRIPESALIAYAIALPDGTAPDVTAPGVSSAPRWGGEQAVAGDSAIARDSAVSRQDAA